MKKFAVCLAAAWLFCSACGHHNPPAPATSPDSTAATDSAGRNYFPVADVLESEIRTVDSTPIAIKEYIIRNGKTDSGYLKQAEFDMLARQFVAPEFRDGSFEKDYTENSFIDNSTQDATFTYSPANKDLPLQRVDIITSAQGTVDHVKSIYLERSRTSGDSSVLDKMFWRSGKGFEVISLVSIKGGAPAEQRLKVVWDGGNQNE